MLSQSWTNTKIREIWPYPGYDAPARQREILGLLNKGCPEIEFVPVDNRIALRSVHLDGFEHRDPADRIIVATALGLKAVLVTADARLRAYAPVATVWD